MLLKLIAFGCLSFSSLKTFNWNRDLFVSNDLGPELNKNIFVKTQTTLSSSENLGDDRVVVPWNSFEMLPFSKAMMLYQEQLGLSKVDVLKSMYIQEVLKHTPDYLKVDMILERSTISQNFKMGFVVQDVFTDFNFSSLKFKRENFKKIVTGLDWFFDINCSFSRVLSRANFEISQGSLFNLLDPKNEDYLRYRAIDKKVLLSALDDARRKLQGLVGVDVGYCEQIGSSDLSLTTGLKKNLANFLNCRRFEIYLGLNLSIPTGAQRNIKNALSFNFGKRASCFGVLGGFDAVLKRDLVAGFAFSVDTGCDYESLDRVAIFEEPSIFSPLEQRVSIKTPGTFSYSPYILFKNLIMNRVDFRVSYLNVFRGQAKVKNITERPFVLNKTELAQSQTPKTTLPSEHDFGFGRFDFKFACKLGDVFSREDERAEAFIEVHYPLTTVHCLAMRGISIGGKFTF